MSLFFRHVRMSCLHHAEFHDHVNYEIISVAFVAVGLLFSLSVMYIQLLPSWAAVHSTAVDHWTADQQVKQLSITVCIYSFIALIVTQHSLDAF
jgi:hypothetical protein